MLHFSDGVTRSQRTSFLPLMDLNAGTFYTPLIQIRSISLEIASAVVERAYQQGLVTEPKPANLKRMIRDLMYDPGY